MANDPRAKDKKTQRDLQADALKIVRSIHIEGQSKPEISAITKGVQRGMEVYLRQQAEKSRELDKRAKKIKQQGQALQASVVEEEMEVPTAASSVWLPWVLFGLSWCGFLIFWVLSLGGN